ncbi:hypothetical protein CYY_009899 [Polysphondylium violaceum]|uniref:DUF985 domain-containing protein n=1 Tax=Polysphondylium violaceum TaxID=133409 RepID=A0A8J4UP69_9MYCE|nr:hypothetical protein CYY_009899 [Polysphondylium violaceum]
MNKKDYWIEKLNLVPHFEGGYFRETIRSQEMVPLQGKGEKNLLTCIFFLMDVSDSVCFRSLTCNEMWLFHYGCRLNVHCLKPQDNSYELVKLGKNLDKGEVFQCVIERDNIFGATIEKDDEFDFALASIVVAPGFDMNDFKLYPKSMIIRYVQTTQ